MNADTKNAIYMAAGIAVFAFVISKFKKYATGESGPLSVVSQGAANAITAFDPGPVIVRGGVRLPDGRFVRFYEDNISVDNQNMFIYLGNVYRITGRNSSGEFSAVRV